MNLPDRLHCPDCKGRLASDSVTELRCTACDRTVPMVDGIADFAVGRVPPLADPQRQRSEPWAGEVPIGDLLAHIRTAAEGRWPNYLGHVLELDCGIGQMTQALVSGEAMRDLLAVESTMENVRSSRNRVAAKDDTPVAFATLGGHQNAIRDAVADTVLGVDVLARTGDLRGLLAMVHRVLKPGGRAWFLVPNRRYRQAVCQAMAEALVQCFARDRTWPEEIHTAVGILARSRLLLVHQGDSAFLAPLEQKHLFDSEALEDLAQEVGFTTAEMIPLDPDPLGVRSTRHLLEAAGLPETFVGAMAPLAASAGQPFFGLLGRQDSSSSMLLWLTKGSSPHVQVFTGWPKPPPVEFRTPEAAVGGPNPRWSVELLARDTPDGVTVKVGGWCLANTDVPWIRITLDGTTRHAPVWRPRPDVHEVMNGMGLFHPFNALCSGLDTNMLFDSVHPVDDQCPLRLEVVLANGLVLMGPTPPTLRMNGPVVINQ
jgi:SAM-dependent methyltransferase